MADETDNDRNYSHVRFPEIPSAEASRDALNRKLSEIQEAFDEIERRRQAMEQQANQPQQAQPEPGPAGPPAE